MKEGKRGKIPPCYGSLEFVIYEAAKKVNEEWERSRARHSKMIDKLRGKLMEGGFLDDTHEKVYELNKQMCDIGKTMNDPFEPLSEEAIQEIAKALEITRNPKDIMKEKKTKKMTKAEAFEWLKGKKVKCYAGITNLNDEPDKVEKFLKDVGCRYHFANHISWRDWYWPLYGFIVDSKGEIYVAFEDQRDFFEQNFNEPISADDILSIEIVEEEKEPLDKWEEFASKVAKIQETLEDDEVCIITKTNYLTMMK